MSSTSRLGRRTVYANPWMTVHEDDVRHPDGSTGIYGVVEKADFALIIPRIGDDFILVEQFRYPVGGRYLEFPQGSWETDPDVDPAELASAELAEETGYRAGSLRSIGDFFEAYGYCNQKCHVFEATDLVAGDPDRKRTEADMRVVRVSDSEFRAAIRDGRIKDGPTIAAYGLLALR